MSDSVKINLEIATQAAELALKNLKKTTDSASNSFDIFKGSFAAGIATDALKGAIGAVTGLLSSMIDNAAQSETAINKLNVALKNSGLFSQNTSKDLQEFASKLQETTIYGDEAVLASSSLFLSLTTLSTSGIKQATKAAADLAATLNLDLNTASEMLAKAINGNYTAFNKLGIVIKSGNTDSERLANTLKALQSQQGAAEAQTKTYAGAMAQLENAKGDLLKTAGKLITQNPLVISGVNLLSEAFSGAANFIIENKENIELLAKSMLYSVGIIAATGAAWATYTVLTGGATVALGLLKIAAVTSWAAVTAPITLVVAAIAAVGLAVYEVIKHWNQIKITIFEATAATLDYAATAANLVSTDLSSKLKAEAQAFRDKSLAVKEASQAELDAANQKKQAEQESANQKDSENEVSRLKKEQLDLIKLNAEKVAARREYNNSIFLADEELQLQLQEAQATHQQAMYELTGSYDEQTFNAQLTRQQELLLIKQQYERDALNASIDASRQKALIIEDANQREKALQEANYKASLETLKLSNKQQLEQVRQKNQAEEILQKNKIANQRDTFSTIATLSNSSNKELAAIGKAAGITQIAIDTPVAISKALAAFPPPYNFAAAALVGTAMAAQAAQIAGLNFANGGIVPGTSYSGDKIQANVNSKEMILNTKQQAQLFRLANGQSNNGTTNNLLIELINAVKQGTSIQIDGREVFNAVRNQANSGRSL